MKKRKIRIGRVILALAIYIIIGIIPLKFTHVRTDQAKSELAQELLAQSRSYPKEIREILKKSAEDPRYARDHIHVWDPDGIGYRPYDTYIGGQKSWHSEAYIVPNTGEKAGRVILGNETTADFLFMLSALWFLGIPFGLLYLCAQDEQNEYDTETQQ